MLYNPFMESEPITINVSPEAAKFYKSVDAEKRRKLDLLISYQLSGMNKPASIEELEAVMDELGRQAEQNGLTPEILEEILDER
jgi:hypothetical protein